ncbi:hypothetical protein IPH70_03625 [Candidatus Roizmanbacteria bacterium]|nr:MAG: hypothetical protein IPH70_03625 [Candidatus Roizmanbacteria bacterium]
MCCQNSFTIHSAKGLEFPVVFLINLTQRPFSTRERKETIPVPMGADKGNKLPIWKRLPSAGEERRLF